MKIKPALFFLLLISGKMMGQINLSNGLVAHFKFDGNAKDEIHTTQDASNYGAALTTDRHGNNNSAYSFDGIDDYMTGNADYFPLAKQPRSISLWAYSNTDDAHKVLFGWGQTVQNKGMGIVILDGRKIRFFGWANDMEAIEYQHPVNKWFNIVAIFDGDTASLYLDGQLWAKSNMNWSTGSAAYQIGRNLNFTSNFSGKLDDIRVYNRILNQDEINALAEVSSGINLKTKTKNQVKIYPNPFFDVITIDLPSNGNYRAIVFNAVGQIIYSGFFNNKINLSHLDNGLYILQVQGKDGEIIAQEKIIK